jgi:hypothetical protein
MINMELRKGGKRRQKKAGKLIQKVLYKRSCMGKFDAQLSLAKATSFHDSALVNLFAAAFS